MAHFNGQGGALMYEISEVMNTELHTLEPDDTLHDARLLMQREHIRHVPVVAEHNRLIGMVSQRDVLAAADSTLIVDPEDPDAKEEHVALSSIMTQDVLTTDEHASLRGVALHMQRHKIGCLPVLREETLVGIVTDSDFVSIAINLLELLADGESEDNDSEAQPGLVVEGVN
jgi:CBS domain-containing membrane protein